MKKETYRKMAEKMEKDLETFIRELKGSELTKEDFEDRLEFEERQFDYIITKIANAITERVGKKKVDNTISRVKQGKATIRQGAKALGLPVGDFIMVLEKKRVFTKKQLEKKLDELLHEK